MSFLVRWFFPRKLAQKLQENDEAYRKQFEEFERQVEVERLQFHADTVEFQNRKIQVDGLKLDMKDSWTQFRTQHLLGFMVANRESNFLFEFFFNFEVGFDRVFGGSETGDVDLEIELEAYESLIQRSRELINWCDLEEGYLEGVTELEDHLRVLEIRDQDIIDTRRLFQNYKSVMDNNERKLKTLLDEYEVERRKYDAYQRMRSIGPYSPSIQAMNGTLVERTQPMGWIGLYLPWINALNGWIGERFGWIGLYFPWIHGTMAEREIYSVVEDAVEEAVVEEAVGDDFDDEFERGIM